MTLKNRLHILILVGFVTIAMLVPAFYTEARERGDRNYPDGREPTTTTPTPDPTPEPDPTPLPTHDYIIISEETLERWKQYIEEGDYWKVLEEYEALIAGEEIPIPDDSEQPTEDGEPPVEDCEPLVDEEEDTGDRRHRTRTITRDRGDTPTTEEVPPVCDEQTEEPDAPSEDPPAEENSDDGEEPTYTELVALEIHNLTNLTREEAGLPPLEADSALESIAKTHSVYMAENNYFSHTRLDGCDLTCRFDEAGYEASAWGENIAWMSSTVLPAPEELALRIFAGWMNSSGHRANILSGNFTNEGVGVAQIGNKVFATVDFARP